MQQAQEHKRAEWRRNLEEINQVVHGFGVLLCLDGLGCCTYGVGEREWSRGELAWGFAEVLIHGAGFL